MLQIRLLVSDNTDIIESIIKDTQILSLVTSLIQQPSKPSDPFLRLGKLECLWILSNCVYVEDNIAMQIFNEWDFKVAMNKLLQNDILDLQVLDLAFFSFGNITGTNSELRKKVLQEFKITEYLVSIIKNQQGWEPFFDNIIWITFNITEEKAKLPEPQAT